MEEWERTAALFKIKFSTGIGENERMARFQNLLVFRQIQIARGQYFVLNLLKVCYVWNSEMNLVGTLMEV